MLSEAAVWDRETIFSDVLMTWNSMKKLDPDMKLMTPGDRCIGKLNLKWTIEVNA